MLKDPEPIRVWLAQPNLSVTCTVEHDDGSASVLPVESLSLRGAQREVTAHLVGEQYAPVGRWLSEKTDGNGAVSRLFRAQSPPDKVSIPPAA